VITETEEDLDEEAIAKLLLGEATSDLGLGDYLDEENLEDASDIDDLASDLLGEKIKQAVAKMLIRASQDGASDIHIEPYENHLRIRFRIDGVLKQFGASLPRQVSPKITAVIKVMAGLDVAENALPRMAVFRGATTTKRSSCACPPCR
jgi:type IV pilus assembly protein PilB